MANQEDVDRLKQDVSIWNNWRQQYPETQPDLSEADFIEVNLYKANLSQTDLYRTNLNGAGLSETNLHKANLYKTDLGRANLKGAYLYEANAIGANFYRANLKGAHLRRAHLRGANFSEAILSGADLSEADLTGVNLSGADLRGVKLSKVFLMDTVLARLDLSVVKGLESVVHGGPSYIDVKTIVFPQGELFTRFMRDVGFPDNFIDYLPTLLATPIQYFSVFISYSHQDENFAKCLYTDLQSKGIRCWFAPEDLKIGDRYHQRIDESIRLYDKFILILSEHSVQSTWVEREVVAAREKEDQQQRLVLFPLRLDDAVMHTTKAWAADVRRQWHIGDFTQWKDHDAYQQTFEKLLRDLKTRVNPEFVHLSDQK